MHTLDELIHELEHVDLNKSVRTAIMIDVLHRIIHKAQELQAEHKVTGWDEFISNAEKIFSDVQGNRSAGYPMVQHGFNEDDLREAVKRLLEISHDISHQLRTEEYFAKHSTEELKGKLQRVEGHLRGLKQEEKQIRHEIAHREREQRLAKHELHEVGAP